MKIILQKKILTDSQDKLKIESTPNGQLMNCFNINVLLSTLHKLSEIKYLDQEINQIYTSGLPNEYLFETLTIPTNIFNTITTKLQILRNKISLALCILDGLKEDDNENTICIKLPDYSNLENLTDDIRLLDKIFQQILSQEKLKSNVKFAGFDVGSNWINIYIPSAAAISFVGRIIWAACVIRKKKIEGDMQLEELKALKISNKTREDIQNAQAELLKKLVQAEATNAIEEQGLKIDNQEYIARTVYAIEKLTDLMNKGIEIHPAITAPEPISDLFPDFKNVLGIQSKAVKTIEDKN